MRFPLIALLLAIAALPACKFWNPDYQPDPDAALRKLLARRVESGKPMPPVAQERLRFAVERLATRHPGHVRSQVAAGALVFAAGEPQRAQGYVDRALSLATANVEARCLRVRIAVADGSLDLARKLVDDGLELRPDAAALYESLAWLEQLEGHMDAALRALDAATALEAPEWRVTFHRGLIEELRGNYDAAEKHYRAAIDANEQCTEARQRLAGLVARRQLKSGR